MKHFLTLLLCILGYSAFSQCTYVIDMQDSFGDGWNGANLQVSINGSFYANYTLPNGSTGQVTFPANNLDVVTFNYNNAGVFPTEVTYQITVGGVQLFSSGANPPVGQTFTHQCGGCDPVGGLTATSITTTSANLGWTVPSGSSGFIVEYGLQGFTPGTGTMATAATSPYNATGLSPSSTYQFYIRRICTSSGDTSIAAGPFTFNTLCGVITAPWSENFFGTVRPNCWTSSGSEPWIFSTGAGYDAATAGDHTGNGGNYAWIDGSSPSGPSQISTLTSPQINVSSLMLPMLSFWVYSHNTNDNTYNTLTVQVYTGTVWVTMATINSDQGSGWSKRMIGLQSLSITGPVQVRFTVAENSPGTSFYNDILIDDVTIKEGPNVSLDDVLGLQSNYCNSPVNVDLVVRNMSSNPESDIPWAVSSMGMVITNGSIPYLAPYASDTISVSLGGIGPLGPNATFSAYTYLINDQALSDDTLTSMVGISFTGVNAAMASPVGCAGAANGSITASGHSGISPYNYMWSNGETNNMATGLVAGSYTVTVMDATGCAAEATLTLMDPASLTLSDTVTNLNCSGNSTGWAMVMPIGGVANYSYLWSNGQMTNQINNVAAGTYTVTVTDATGCQISTSVSITEPTPVDVVVTDNADGTATANATGGNGSYTYQWDAAAGNQTTQTATGLTNGGVYYVVVTDANGCNDVVTFQAIVVGVEAISSIANLNLFPNPTNGNVFVELNLVEQSEVLVRIMNVTGQTVLTKNLGTTQSDKIELETAILPNGVYMVQFNIGNEQVTKKLIVAK